MSAKDEFIFSFAAYCPIRSFRRFRVHSKALKVNFPRANDFPVPRTQLQRRYWMFFARLSCYKWLLLGHYARRTEVVETISRVARTTPPSSAQAVFLEARAWAPKVTVGGGGWWSKSGDQKERYGNVLIIIRRGRLVVVIIFNPFFLYIFFFSCSESLPPPPPSFV